MKNVYFEFFHTVTRYRSLNKKKEAMDEMEFRNGIEFLLLLCTEKLRRFKYSPE